MATDPATLDQEPRIATRVDGLGADVSRRDPFGRLALQLIEKKTSALSPDTVTQEPSQELALHRPENDPKRIKKIEIKDLRQTLEIEAWYDDMNSWV